MIHHVNFQMPERLARECASFYELLGFVRVEPPESLAARAIWMASGGTQIHLQYADKLGESGPGHVAIVVDDYDAKLGLLRSAGVTVEERAAHWGSPRCYLRDPALNRLELMAFAPPAA